MSQPKPTSYETGTAEAWLTVLDYVSRVAQAVEGGDWYYLVDKSDALERAVKALRGRVWDDDTSRLDIEDPQTGRPLRAEPSTRRRERERAAPDPAMPALRDGEVVPTGAGCPGSPGGLHADRWRPSRWDAPRVRRGVRGRRPVTVHPAALVLADHEVARWSRRGTVAHCDCGTATVDHPAHLTEMLHQAGLLADGPPPETPTERVLTERGQQ